MAKINTIGLVEILNPKQINEKTINVTANPGQLTVDYRKENAHANVTKVAGQAGFNVDYYSPNEIITDTVVDELKDYLNLKFEAVMALFNTEI